MKPQVTADDLPRLHPDWTSIRRQLACQGPNQQWTSLEELANTAGFQQSVQDEFPPGAAAWNDPASRRDFLKIMAASLALAGATSCTRQPLEKIVPYVKQPELVVPGKPLYFATSLALNGPATGVLVENHEGRPTKIEGNPEHPGSLGATSVFEQATILDLYDPERARNVSRQGNISSWKLFLGSLVNALERQRAKGGAGLRVLTGAIHSPTLVAQLQTMLQEFPGAKWVQFEPISRHSVSEGARLAFGRDVETQLRLQQAEVILSLDSDFLHWHPNRIRCARDFVRGRRVDRSEEQTKVAPTSQPAMNRLYVVESTPTITGAMADHRLPMEAGKIAGFAAAIVKNLQGSGPANFSHPWTESLSHDLQKHAGKSLVIAGDQQPAFVHALAHWMNHHLGNVGRTVFHVHPASPPVDRLEALGELCREMRAGAVEMLLVLGDNPVHTAPIDFEMGPALANLPWSAHWSLYVNDTSPRCTWHLPAAHPLESWSDARAFDGTISIVQPLIEPLFGGISPHELIGQFLAGPQRNAYEIVRDYWRRQRPELDAWWSRALHDGLIADTASQAVNVDLQFTPPDPPAHTAPALSASNLEIAFRPDPTTWDGRFANNAWLQELPKPIHKVTWDNPALISPALAERLQLATGDLIELRRRGKTLRAAVLIVPGQPEYSVALSLGHGGDQVGAVAAGIGFNSYALRATDNFWFGDGLQIHKTGEHHPLARTQLHYRMEGRALARHGTLQQWLEDPEFIHKMGETPDPNHLLYNLTAEERAGYRWGMVINLNTCIGCNACTIACQAENNIPVVGREEVQRGREMHWIRVDTYFQAGLENPGMIHQPVPCMHCETAPCEYVCPVAATSHSNEGLNEMTYNRCIGTRYCSNNCPYKVRRFNFFSYGEQFARSTRALLLNPDVTIRTRGVMEKCTYCVQRINGARIEAKKENRRIRDQEVVPACAQVCPTEAITFGDLNTPASEVSRLKSSSLNYGMLEDRNTRPRTTYLAKLANPNPAPGLPPFPAPQSLVPP
jgi:MoCo/4Fe-4S cofactor protein with predicted Tat translocation signal